MNYLVSISGQLSPLAIQIENGGFAWNYSTKEICALATGNEKEAKVCGASVWEATPRDVVSLFKQLSKLAQSHAGVAVSLLSVSVTKAADVPLADRVSFRPISLSDRFVLRTVDGGDGLTVVEGTLPVAVNYPEFLVWTAASLLDKAEL